jgi:hypothetical protein
MKFINSIEHKIKGSDIKNYQVQIQSLKSQENLPMSQSLGRKELIPEFINLIKKKTRLLSIFLYEFQIDGFQSKKIHNSIRLSQELKNSIQHQHPSSHPEECIFSLVKSITG